MSRRNFYAKILGGWLECAGGKGHSVGESPGFSGDFNPAGQRLCGAVTEVEGKFRAGFKVDLRIQAAENFRADIGGEVGNGKIAGND